MVVSVTIQHLFKYPLEFVAKTHFQKYPSKGEKFVVRVDTVEHRRDVVHGVNYWKRIAVCANVIPGILRTINVLNEQNFLLEEEAWLDFRKPEFRLQSCNITWSKYAHIWEESTFKPSQDNPKWTVLEQHGVVEVKAFGPFGRVLEMFAQRFLQSGVKRGLRIMEELLQERASKAYIIQDNPSVS
ncbi:PRELI domain-containing protein 2-like [Haliotis cracherodii]|uniref:PRELI domain-containing protein 2-like n=1 Tax=Haliotis cracherodii TaxID=6455 RepID=UPI0039E76A87